MRRGIRQPPRVMKTSCALLTLLALSAPLPAEIKIPKDVFRVAQYEEAVTQAKTQKKPLAFVVLDLASETKGAEESAEDAFDAVKGYGVVVVISTAAQNTDFRELSPPFYTAFVDTGALSLPVVMLAAPSEDFVWKTISPPRKITAKDLRKLFRDGVAEVKPTVAAWFAAKTPPAPVAPGDKPLSWMLANGSGYQGVFIKVEGDKLYIRNAAGEVTSGKPLSDFKPATVRYAKMLAGLAVAPAATAASGPPAVEKWTNQEGREIEATFVSLKDGKVTLLLSTGKDSTVPLDSLSEASQARVKELAGK